MRISAYRISDGENFETLRSIFRVVVATSCISKAVGRNVVSVGTFLTWLAHPPKDAQLEEEQMISQSLDRLTDGQDFEIDLRAPAAGIVHDILSAKQRIKQERNNA